MKKIIYLAAAFLCMACSDDHESDQQHGGASGSVTEVTPVTSDLSVDLSTDKAFYKPGEKVVFTADDALPAGIKVRYRLLGSIGTFPYPNLPNKDSQSPFRLSPVQAYKRYGYRFHNSFR